MKRLRSSPGLAALLVLLLWGFVSSSRAAEPDGKPLTPEDVQKNLDAGIKDAKVNADSAWMLVSSAFVLFMVPGLALFYGGMVRRKNILGTMMHSMVALAVVGVYWVAVGYSLAFGDPMLGGDKTSLLGWSSGLFFLKDVAPTTLLPNTNIPVYLHVMFQGMFAIITPALISGAVAERIRFKPYCLFLILWVTFVYCPLAHWVWAMDWNWSNTLAAVPVQKLLDVSGKNPVGWLGSKEIFQSMFGSGASGALDFAGGTVVHIAAGLSSLAAILLLRKRLGYPEHAMHPNSMVLTLLGAGMLWFGWFGFNGGSALGSGAQAALAFSATQAAAAAAGLSWMLAEWFHKGKPTALGLASGIVAGLVAVTPASGFVYPMGGLFIGLIAGIVCYLAVCLKPVFEYDDSLDAFGVHGVGGFLGAVLTGVFCYQIKTGSGADDVIGAEGLLAGGSFAQPITQLIAAGSAVVFAFAVSLVLVKLVDLLIGFNTDEHSETEGLDRTEHGEVGFDLGPALEVAPTSAEVEPRAARVPPGGARRFSLVVEGVKNGELLHAWSELCQPGPRPPAAEFKAVYPYLTTVQGNRFRFRGGNPEEMRSNLERLFQAHLTNGPLRVHVEK